MKKYSCKTRSAMKWRMLDLSQTFLMCFITYGNDREALFMCLCMLCFPLSFYFFVCFQHINIIGIFAFPSFEVFLAIFSSLISPSPFSVFLKNSQPPFIQQLDNTVVYHTNWQSFSNIGWSRMQLNTQGPLKFL